MRNGAKPLKSVFIMLIIIFGICIIEIGFIFTKIPSSYAAINPALTEFLQEIMYNLRKA